MKTKLIAILMGVAGLLSVVPVGAAFAAACSASSCTLDVWNTTELQASGDTVTVTLNTGAHTLTFTFNDAAGTPDPDYKLMKTIGWNVVDGGANANFDTPNSPSPYTLDGFGSFSIAYNSTLNGAGPFPTSFTFTGIDATTLVGATFAVHVQYQNNCSGWVGNGTNSGASSNTGCGGTSVPEPTSLMLLGAGLAGLGIWRRKQA